MAHPDVLRDMALFVEVARTRSFARAATSLGLAVSSLSRRMTHLEAAVGLRLIDRSTRGQLVLTPHGEAYLPEASRLVAEAERTLEAIASPLGAPSTDTDPQVELDACSSTILAELRALNDHLESRL